MYIDKYKGKRLNINEIKRDKELTDYERKLLLGRAKNQDVDKLNMTFIELIDKGHKVERLEDVVESKHNRQHKPIKLDLNMRGAKSFGKRLFRRF